MSYAEILKDYISKSGKTLEQISKECELRGHTIHTTYISKLRLGQRPAPSDEISRVLAEVTNGDPEKLIAAGYIERAPEEVRGVISHYLKNLNMYARYVAYFLMDIEDQEKSEEELREIHENIVQTIMDIPYEERIDFIINHYNRVMYTHPDLLRELGELQEVPRERVDFTIESIQEKPLNRIKVIDLSNDEESYEWVPISKIRFGEFIYLIAADDSMIGAGIAIGAKLLCQTDGDDLYGENEELSIDSGKIYAISYKEKVLIRRVFKDGNNITLQSENSKYPPIVINKDNHKDFLIWGLIKSVEFELNKD
ncbi:LexA family protein [Paenibacillus graminis]|uniref:LexA family protein n=2 Tax=Paenibacillus graminis TaxID=189425 RepID=UPI002DBD39F6|nr:S24 family peptidase [Paenibacillus graminis]MEC0171137.1 S24 family peptidase [Paenibacillus graminis]